MTPKTMREANWKEFIIPSHHVISTREDESTGGVEVIADLAKPIEYLLRSVFEEIEKKHCERMIIWKESHKAELKKDLVEWSIDNLLQDQEYDIKELRQKYLPIKKEGK